MRTDRTKKLSYQRQIAFSIGWTRQEPRDLVGSSVISDWAVPGSNFTVASSLFLCNSLSFMTTAPDDRHKSWNLKLSKETKKLCVQSWCCTALPALGTEHRSRVGITHHCNSFFLQSEDCEKFQSLSHVWRWPPHMRASEVYSNLPGGYYKIYKPPRRLL